MNPLKIKVLRPATLIVYLAILFLFGGVGVVFPQDTEPEISTSDLVIPGENSAAGGGGAQPAETSSIGTSAGPSGKMTLLQQVEKGGWAMIPLGLLSFITLFLLVLNLINLQKKFFFPDSLVNSLGRSLEACDLEAAKQTASGSATCLGQVMLAGLGQVSTRGYPVLDTERFENQLAAASRRFNRGRARTVNYFAVIAQAAPMLGLLGTVSGMIKAFQNLGREGMGDPSKLAGNISEALVTTAAGLLVALPAIFCYFYFRDRLRGLVGANDDRSLDLFEKLRQGVVDQQATGQQPPA